MFSDVRGFTGFAEHRPPDQVIDALNRYLTVMSDVILDHGGTLVSYMGDGIMAVFGAPLTLDDHADRAVAAARQMTGETLERFNDGLRADFGAEGFRIGVGLNSGPVMSGNVGSERRLEYTAIGDTVNTASRVEQLTKVTGTMVLLTAATRALLARERRGTARVGELEIRGRQEAVEVWTLAETEAPRAGAWRGSRFGPGPPRPR
jgi:adenylate cyclase